MSGPPRLVNVTYLYFQVTKAVDNGQTASVTSAHDALIDGHAMNFLDQYQEVDLEAYKDQNDGPQGWDWDEMNSMFERYVTADPHDLCVTDNGLQFILAQIVELIQSDWWSHPKVSGNIDLRDAEIERDW